MKHTISVLVENYFGAFDRVATMFSGKGFNIHSISIGETEIKEVSRMTIVTSGNDQIIDQVVKQLNRLIDTVKVVDLSQRGPHPAVVDHFGALPKVGNLAASHLFRFGHPFDTLFVIEHLRNDLCGRAGKGRNNA